jgi:Domain of unknown function (DUF4266)
LAFSFGVNNRDVVLRRVAPGRTSMRWIHCRLAGLALLLPLCGCAGLGVQPWERDLLARPGMQPAGAPLLSAIDDHTYFSKEAASGGRSFAGGGCGCN